LVAARCVPLGFGSDIGGSVRIPPAFCGVVGFKPTSTRTSIKGHTFYCNAFEGQSCINVYKNKKKIYKNFNFKISKFFIFF
jgi:Asp-tRNA(Asn)/Glu-tRNA(Gln) amidotransferase A subunit family amidase